MSTQARSLGIIEFPTLPGAKVDIAFESRLPHGETTCSKCGLTKKEM
jgi:hypothetical protein